MHFSEYHRVIEALLDHGAIERIGYSAGQQSFGYRLSERFIGDKHIRLPVSDPRLISRLPRFFWRAEADRLSRMKPVHHLLAEQQYRLQIDGDDARQILDSLPPKSNPYDVQGILVRDIECRKFQLNVGRYGRVSNNITSMKREVRKALRVNGEPLVSVDISCAQPALLAKIIKDKPRQRERQTKERKAEERSKQETQLPKGSIYDVHEILPSLPNDDLALFETLVLNGKFYAFLLDHLHRLGIPMERETLKRKFLADVIAKRKANRYGAEYPSQVEDIFRLLFPTVYGFIRDFNNDGWHHENLIRELQRQESKLVIETVAAALTTQYPDTFFLTLHDAIYTTSNHIPKVEQAFKNAFTQIGFQMTLKTA
jgi:hypothetical protein